MYIFIFVIYMGTKRSKFTNFKTFINKVSITSSQLCPRAIFVAPMDLETLTRQPFLSLEQREHGFFLFFH